MKKLFALAISLFILPCIAFAEPVSIFELEDGIAFEMSMAEVQAQSMRDFHKGSSTELICNTTLFEIETSIALNFGKKDTLYEIICQLSTDGMRPKYCIADYDEVHLALLERYGDATLARQGWKSKAAYDAYGDDLESALDNQAVAMIEYWDFTDVYIVHTLMKTSNNEIQHFLCFYSPILHPDIDDIRRNFGR